MDRNTNLKKEQKIQSRVTPVDWGAAKWNPTDNYGPSTDSLDIQKGNINSIQGFSTGEIIKRAQSIMNPYEEFRGYVYDDLNPYENMNSHNMGPYRGKPTIGYGTTNRDIIKHYLNSDKVMDKDIALEMQTDYISKEILPRLQKTTYYNDLNIDQIASLVSLMYNIGNTKFFGASPKLQAALNAGSYEEAVSQMNHGLNDSRFDGLVDRRRTEQQVFIGDMLWNGNKYDYPNMVAKLYNKYKKGGPIYDTFENSIVIPEDIKRVKEHKKEISDKWQKLNESFNKYKEGGKIRKHQIGQTVNWSTEPQGWKAYDEYKAKQNQIDFQNKVREANNPANNPLLNKPAPVVNQDWRNQDTYSNWQSRQRAKQAKYEQSAPYKIGTRLKEGAQVLIGSLGHFGMNIPFDIARSAGAKIPETMFSPTAFNDVNPNQSVGDFTKQTIGRGADIVSFELGMGMIPGLVGGKALRNATPGMLTNNPVRSVPKTNNWNKVNQLEYDVKKKYGEVKRNINNSFENNYWRKKRFDDMALERSKRVFNTDKVKFLDMPFGRPDRDILFESNRKYTSPLDGKIIKLKHLRKNLTKGSKLTDDPLLNEQINQQTWDDLKKSQGEFSNWIKKFKRYMEFNEFDGGQTKFVGDQWGPKTYNEMIHQINKRKLEVPAKLRSDYSEWANNLNKNLSKEFGKDVHMGGSSLNFIKGQTNILPGDIDRYVLGNPSEKFTHWSSPSRTQYKFGNYNYIGNKSEPGLAQVHMAYQNPKKLHNINFNFTKNKIANKKGIVEATETGTSPFKIDNSKLDFDNSTLTDLFLSGKPKHLERFYKVVASPNTSVGELEKAFQTRLQGASARNIKFPEFNTSDFKSNMEYLSKTSSGLSNNEMRQLASSPERMKVLLQDHYFNNVTGTRYLDRYPGNTNSVINYLHSSNGSGGQAYSNSPGLDVYFGKQNTNSNYGRSDKLSISAKTDIDWPKDMTNPTATDLLNNLNNLKDGVRIYHQDIMTFPFNEKTGRGAGNILKVSEGTLDPFAPRIVRKYPEVSKIEIPKSQNISNVRQEKVNKISNNIDNIINYMDKHNETERLKHIEDSNLTDNLLTWRDAIVTKGWEDEMRDSRNGAIKQVLGIGVPVGSAVGTAITNPGIFYKKPPKDLPQEYIDFQNNNPEKYKTSYEEDPQNYKAYRDWRLEKLRRIFKKTKPL